jgi:hypothetical protein
MDEVVCIRYLLNYKNILDKVVNDQGPYMHTLLNPGPCMNGLIRPRVYWGG